MRMFLEISRFILLVWIGLLGFAQAQVIAKNDSVQVNLNWKKGTKHQYRYTMVVKSDGAVDTTCYDLLLHVHSVSDTAFLIRMTYDYSASKDALIRDLFDGFEVEYMVRKTGGIRINGLDKLYEEVKRRFLLVAETTDSTNYTRVFQLSQEFSAENALAESFNEIRFLVGHRTSSYPLNTYQESTSEISGIGPGLPAIFKEGFFVSGDKKSGTKHTLKVSLMADTEKSNAWFIEEQNKSLRQQTGDPNAQIASDLVIDFKNQWETEVDINRKTGTVLHYHYEKQIFVQGTGAIITRDIVLKE